MKRRTTLKFFKFKINSAVSLDRTKNQWIDLGIHTEACMTRPETCGEAGGAISVWMRVIDSPTDNLYSYGIISTQQTSTKAGSGIYCFGGNMR